MALALTVSHMAGGWLLAGALHRNALIPRPPRPTPGLAVRSIYGDLISLETGGPSPEIGHPGVIGLTWEQGYAQIGEVVGVEGRVVTRSYRLS